MPVFQSKSKSLILSHWPNIISSLRPGYVPTKSSKLMLPGGVGWLVCWCVCASVCVIALSVPNKWKRFLTFSRPTTMLMSSQIRFFRWPTKVNDLWLNTISATTTTPTTLVQWVISKERGSKRGMCEYGADNFIVFLAKDFPVRSCQWLAGGYAGGWVGN